MNCKPGDLAIIVACNRTELIGRMVEVLSRAPEGEFSLPDGARSESGPDSWVVQFQRPAVTTSAFGIPIMVVFGSARDSSLRPIRNPGEDAVDESKAWLPPVPLPAIDPSLLPAKESA